MKRDEIRLKDGTVSMLRWDDAGPTAPLLHIAHATGLNAQTYRQLGDRLSGRFRIIASDARGHGFTGLPADPTRLTSWMRYVEDLSTLLDAIGEPVFLAGHSMGATVSLLVAATRPDLARGLVLLDPALVPYAMVDEREAEEKAGVLRESEIARVASRRRADFDSREAIRKAYDGRGMFAWWGPGMLDDYLDGGLRDTPDGHVTLACTPAWEAATFGAVTSQVWRQAPNCRAPIALMRADINSTFSADDAVTFQRMQPGAVIAHAEGRTHFLPQEDLDLVARFADENLNRMLAGAPAR